MIWGILLVIGLFGGAWAWTTYREKLDDDSKRAKAMDTTDKIVDGAATAWDIIRGVGLILLGIISIFGLRDVKGIGFGIVMIGAGIYLLL